MRQYRRQDVVIFEDRPIALPAFLAAMSLVFAVNLFPRGISLLDGEKQAIGMLMGALFCALGAMLLYRRDRFSFDVAGRRLRWRKWSIFGSSSGEIRFDDIIGVTIESMSGSEGGGTYRVALRIPDGTLPLTESYSGTAETWRPVAGRLRAILGLEGGSTADSDVAALMSQGRKIDAIRQLRETEDLSLTDAGKKAAILERRSD